MNSRNCNRLSRFILLSGAFLFFVPLSMPQRPSAVGSPATPDTTQIVQAIERRDQRQSTTLTRYRAMRHYNVEYQGFMKHITASMDVELEYDPASGKDFKIISQSGSHMLCEKVIKRALDSEKDASHDKGSHALTQENYKFQFLGSEMVDGRTAYVLQVDPVSGSPYLYRGKIWVDASDDAVSRMEVQPAKNPSFWISQTLIHQKNFRIDGFWLPLQNQSETKVRIGGKATLTIDYGPYEIAPPQAAGSAYPELATATVQAQIK